MGADSIHFLNWIGFNHDRLFDTVIGTVFLLQLSILVLLIVGTWIKKSIFLRRKNYQNRHYEEVRQLLVQYVFEEDRISLFREIRSWSLNKRFSLCLRDLILTTAASLAGKPRDVLAELYSCMGYLERDIQLLKSRRWWVRLKALTRLDIMIPEDKIDLIKSAVDDSNSLVSMAALRVLRDKDFLGKSSWIMEKLLKMSQPRKDVFMDIFLSLLETDPLALVKILEKQSEIKKMPWIENVLKEYQVPEAMRFLEGISEHKEDQSVDLAGHILEQMKREQS